MSFNVLACNPNAKNRGTYGIGRRREVFSFFLRLSCTKCLNNQFVFGILSSPFFVPSLASLGLNTY